MPDHSATDLSAAVAAPSTPPTKLTQPALLDGSPASDGSDGASLSNSVISSGSTLIEPVSPYKKDSLLVTSATYSPPTVTVHPSPECLTPPAMSEELDPTIDPAFDPPISLLSQSTEAFASAISGLTEKQAERVTKFVETQHAVFAQFQSMFDDARKHWAKDRKDKVLISQAFADYKVAAEAKAEKLQDGMDRLIAAHKESVAKTAGEHAAERAADKVAAAAERTAERAADKAAVDAERAADRAAADAAQARVEARFASMDQQATERAAKQEADRAAERAADQARVYTAMAEAKAKSDEEKAKSDEEKAKAKADSDAEMAEAKATIARLVTETQSMATEVTDLRSWSISKASNF